MSDDDAQVRACAWQELRQYLAVFPDDAARLKLLLAQLNTPGDDLAARSNMRGHITSSLLTFDRAHAHVLLIDHIGLQRWLPPGGHFERSNPIQHGSYIYSSAARETSEETALRAFRPVRWLGHANIVPIDIDTHRIPASSRKGEGEHPHHDFMYLAEAENAQMLGAQHGEVAAARWVPVNDAARADVRIARVIKRMNVVRDWTTAQRGAN